MRYRLRTLMIVLGLGPAVLAGICSVAYLGWAWSQGVIGTNPAVLRELERAREAGTVHFDPAIHAYPHESYEEAVERHEKMKRQANAPEH